MEINVKTYVAKKGITLPMTGAPSQSIERARRGGTVALLPADHRGLKPRLKVQVGDIVRRGELLFEDRKNGRLRFTSPGAGKVVAVHRGERRAVLSVVVALSGDESTDGADVPEVVYEAHNGKTPEQHSDGEIRSLLLESGLWCSFRARPFGGIPAPEGPLHALFVTAMDSHPLAPEVEVALSGREDDFLVGLAALGKLAGNAKVHLCRAPGSLEWVGAIPGLEICEFAGPHPAGTVGWHIHKVAPADRERASWHMGYQDVAAVGHLLRTGRMEVERVVSLAGPSVKTPRLLRTRLGVSLDALLAGELVPRENRVLSGSVFNGRTAAGSETGYLGRFHNQITVLPEGREQRLFGWLSPGLGRFTASRLFLSRLTPRKKRPFDTNAGGGLRTMVPVGFYEKVWPFDLLATPLLRSLLAGDDERAEELGCLELEEEDVALLCFVCPSKIDYGAALRRALVRIEEAG